MERILLTIGDHMQYMKLLLSKVGNKVKLEEKHYYKSKSHNKEYFYCRTKRDGKLVRDFLGKADSILVKQAKAEQMRAALADALSFDVELFEDVMKKFKPFDVHSLERSIPPCLQNVSADFVVDESVQMLWDWAKQEYERNSTPFPKQENYAIDGTRVRSKGEELWYNDFTTLWVPMRYDPVMELINPKPGILGPGNRIWKSPDFLLKCIDGTYIIVEHLGMLQDNRYADDFKEKVQIFQANGFVPGVNFYIMSDDIYGGTNSRAIHEMVDEIKWKVYHGTGLKPPPMEW